MIVSDSFFLYFIGLIILAIAIGNVTTAPIGFIVLGGGLVIASLFHGFISYLDGKRK